MLDIMYDLPSLTDVVECIIDADTVRSVGQPVLVKEKRAS